MDRVFPGRNWQRRTPDDVGISSEKLAKAERCLHELAGEPFCAVIVRNGYLVAEWDRGLKTSQAIPITSASKSAYSCLLGIAVAERAIPGLDSRVVDFYPEMMAVRDGEGPKLGRYAFDANRDITFRQLIGNTSGYMKPGEKPGEKFHYQTFGMNVLTNALATVYGLYDSTDPSRLKGCGDLLESKIGNEIGGTWTYTYRDFEYSTGKAAKRGIFGHGLQIVANAYDTARLGHLWMNFGRWDGKQVVPRTYLEQATRTNPDVLRQEPEENWKYGYGFWVNDFGKLWPDISRDFYGAWGGGAKYVWVSPVLDLVVTMNPGPWDAIRSESERLPRERAVLGRIVDAIEN